MLRRICFVWMLSLIGLAGCAGTDEPSSPNNDDSNNGACQDRDGDGYLGLTSQCVKGSDCDDSNNTINPAAAEICGNGRDDDCQQGDEPCEQECIDADGDRYGEGEGCLGPDCDDTSAAINPREAEICGNGVDEDCDGIDNECPTNCTDNDRDGYGIDGENDDCPRTGVDCDDSAETVYPEAQEVCNGVDDDCDGDVDECVDPNAACSGTEPTDSCVAAVGGSCQDDGDCAADARCDQSVSECRLIEGSTCTSDDECVQGLACDGGSCSGDFCAVTQCSGAQSHCDPDAQRCVECRYWDSSAGDDDCPAAEVCTPQGWCALPVQISDADPVDGHPSLNNDVYTLSLALADCWIDKKGGSNDMCAALTVDAAVGSAITKSETKSALTDGHLDFLNEDRFQALRDLWGIGWNIKNLDWRADPQPDTSFETCIWHNTEWVNELFVGRCADYIP